MLCCCGGEYFCCCGTSVTNGTPVLLQHGVFHNCVLLPSLHVYAHHNSRDHRKRMRYYSAFHAVARKCGEGFPHFAVVAGAA